MKDLSYRMLQIGGVPAGLLGLEELFDELYNSGITPDNDEISNLLVSGLRKHNFVPKPAIKDYQFVLEIEYHTYFNVRSGGDGQAAKDFGYWEGYPREQIPWFPTVSAELCNGCLKCIEICPKDVFVKLDNGKVAVNEPFLCIVGCCFCKSVCDPQAILLPNKEMLEQMRHGQRHAT
jgi:NAD-dependent dihydropyrimidine dehydrogenase PreA subunit